MKSVYIASPYTKPEGKQLENVNKSFDAANKLIDLGYAPYCPLFSHYLDEGQSRSWNVWMDLDVYWLKKCDYLLRLPGESKGADIEVKLADKLNIPVFFNIEDLPKHKNRTEDK